MLMSFSSLKEFDYVPNSLYGVLSDKTYLRVNILLYPFFLPPGYCFLGLGLETFGIGAVLSLSVSSGICGRIMSYRYHWR